MKRKHSRFISTIVLLCTLMSLLSACVQDDRVPESSTPKSPDTSNTIIPERLSALGYFTDNLIQNKEEALAAIQEVSMITGITNVAETLGECREYTSLDSVFYRFNQTYNAIPVYGRSVIVGTSTDGVSQGLSHNYAPIDNVNTVPAISEDSALDVIFDRYSSNSNITPKGLTIYSLFDHVPVLAWQFEISGPALLDTCFVDAHSGAFITAFSGILVETEVGTYTDSNGVIDFNTVNNLDGSYSLSDEIRNIHVYDANYQTVTYAVVDDAGNTYRYDSDQDAWVDINGNQVTIPGDDNAYGSWNVLDMNGNVVGRNADYLPCTGNPLAALTILSNSSTMWSNQKAAAAMSLTEDVYDFYQTILHRSGFNGSNGTVRISINDDINGDSSNAYSSMGGTRAFTVLSFGHAGAITADLVGHEYNHSVEQSISGLAYQSESGAIMEGLADVFGELAEDWMSDYLLDDDCDWIHGSRNMIDPTSSTQETCYYEYNGQACPVKAKQKDGKHVIGEEVKEPGWFSSGSCWIDIPYPNYYRGDNYFYGTGDHGGVHTNATVISHAVYLMTHPDNSSVEALTNEELARLLYYALSYLPTDCSFNAFASYVCLSAEVLKLPEAKQDCVVQAFRDVGIKADNVLLVSAYDDPLDYMVTDTSEWHVFGKNGALCDNYILRISGKETLKNLYHTGPFEESDPTVTEYVVTSKEPLTLTLEAGYMYDFEFIDGMDPTRMSLFCVGVYEDSLGLISVVDVKTQFGPAWSTNDSNLVFLTERPASPRPGLLIFKDYVFDGAVYQASGGGYSAETFYPSELNTIASFVGDFYHGGRDTTFTVKRTYDGMDYSNGLWLKFVSPGSKTIGSNALSLYADRETYYYLIDGEETAYLVCEQIEYDNVSLENGIYHYKTALNEHRMITESIKITNLATSAEHTFYAKYYESMSYIQFSEKYFSWNWDRFEKDLYYHGSSNVAEFADVQQAVAYIQDKLSAYGLSDRVFCQKSELVNYTPVFSSSVSGIPKAINVKTMDDTSIQGNVSIGFPAYTGTWFPDGIVKGQGKPTEETIGTSAADKYQAFLVNRGYLSDWTSTDCHNYYTLESYSIIDINQDGTEELIILSNSDIGFHAFLVYGIDATTGVVTRFPVERSETENNIISCYGEPRYSSKYKALVFSEIKPTAICGGIEYFVVDSKCLYSIGTVGNDYLEGNPVYFTTLDGSFEEISEKSRDSYTSELQWIDYTPLP